MEPSTLLQMCIEHVLDRGDGFQENINQDDLELLNASEEVIVLSQDKNSGGKSLSDGSVKEQGHHVSSTTTASSERE